MILAVFLPTSHNVVLVYDEQYKIIFLIFDITVISFSLPTVARTQKDKDRLSNMMAYGEDIAPPSSKSLQAAREKMWRDQLQQLDDPSQGSDRFDERM